MPPGVGLEHVISDFKHDPRYRPRLSAELDTPGMVVWGTFRVCADTAGAVTEVVTLRSAHPSVDPAWMAVMRTWQHRPYTLDGTAIPFCYPIRGEIRSTK